ncbi:MAG: tetratricopeptide repeat protein [Bryobacteraceae bacterium]
MAHLGKGAELMRSERYQEAAKQFEEALNEDAKLDQARLNLAICDFELRDYTTARRLFSSLIGSKDQAREATYYLGRVDLLEDHVDSAITRFRSLGDRELRDEKYYLAVALLRKQVYAESAALLKQWIAENPRDFRAHQRLGRVLLKLGEQEQAEQEFQRTKDLQNYYMEGSDALRACQRLLTAGKSDQAWQQCGSMAETDDVDKLAALGLAFGSQGDANHARTIWERAVRLDPDSPEINYNLALACFHLRDMAHAKSYAGNAVRLWPDFPEANVLYGTILYMLADDALAKQVLSHAQELRPDDEMVRRLLGELRAR